MEETDELVYAFIEEAQEHLPVIEASLLSLEKNPNDFETLNELFRSVHTIKGGSGFFGFEKIGALTHCMESLLSLARNQKLSLQNVHIDALLTAQDCLLKMIDAPDESNQVNIDKECQLLEELTLQSENNAFPENKQLEPETTEKDVTDLKETTKNFEEDSESFLEGCNECLDDADDTLLESFITEALESLPMIERCLLALEANPSDMLQLNDLFRHVHTIKGGACFLGLKKIAELSHVIEGLLSQAKQVNLILEEPHIEALLEAYDVLNLLVENHTESETSTIDIVKICHRLQQLQETEVEKNVVVTEIEESLQYTQTNDNLEHQTSNSQKAAINKASTVTKQSPSAEVKVNNSQNIETEENIRVNVKRLNKLIDLAGELVLVRNQLVRLCEPLITQVPGLKVVLHNFNRITTEMQEEIMSTRMQPVGIIFNKFPRLIRQLEKDLDKKLDLVTEGAEVELDKSIIESLSDPVTHIIRNMADHGIESPQERLKKGKPANGTLLQKAFHESGQVVIQFSDDGAGIDPEFIAAKAIEKNIATVEALEKMTAKEKINLIFTPGFSTAENVSSVSGRGIGMDVVKTNIEACGGTIDINSELGKWTSITMTLPLTMAIISALIVRVQDCRFAFPQGNLEEMVLLEAEDYTNKIGQVRGRQMLELRGDFLPLISLANSLKISSKPLKATDKPLHILIIKAENNRVAVVVDQILGGEEIVVKPMPEYFRHLKNFSGTSILGDGSIAMIIDVQGYIQKNKLAYTELQQNQEIKKMDIEYESQSLLIFDNNTEEHFALALSWIRRIDTIDISIIQSIASEEYIDYRGEQVRLLRLENCLPVTKPQQYAQIAHVIIPKHAKVPVALLINRVIDTKNTVIKLENASIKTPGILGSMLLDGKITLMLDMHSILELGEPESVEKVDINPEYAQNKHVLLVEDTPFFMKVVTDCVLSAGYQVTTATNGREGLELLNQQHFDLVLTDIEMPLMDGREMVKHIRADSQWNNLPVIALTTLSDANTVEEGKRLGFNEWLIKLDKELLLKTLSHYL